MPRDMDQSRSLKVNLNEGVKELYSLWEEIGQSKRDFSFHFKVIFFQGLMKLLREKEKIPWKNISRCFWRE